MKRCSCDCHNPWLNAAIWFVVGVTFTVLEVAFLRAMAVLL